MSFTQVFGGQNISPSQLSYSALAISADTQLYWPLETSSSGPYVTSKLDVTPSGAGLSIIMPNATQVTPGQDCLVLNPSAYTLTIKAYDGSTIGTVAPSLAWLFWVKDNSTEAGTWGSVQYGAGSSSVSAAALAGLGLTPISTLLNTAFRTTTINANYTAGANDRASLINSTGGAITLSLAASATLGSNWFCLVRNSGSGSLVIDPNGAETIDGAATKTLTIGESCFIICNGTNLFSVGYGRSLVNTVSAINITASGSGVQTLSSSEVAAQVQSFSGTLSGDQQFEYGTAPGFWFVSNGITLAGHVATWRVNNLDAGVTSADVASGTRAILVSNGTNMFLAVSSNAGTVTQVNTGTGLTGGPITSSGTIALANTAVSPGSYGGAAASVGITVDAQGRLTAASDSTLTVAGGGTGATTLTSKSVLIGNGTSAITGVAPGAANNVLISNGTDWISSAVPVSAVVPTGTTVDFVGSTAPTGWVLLSGLTIGSASSGATGRANADTQPLFELLWNSMANAQAPVSGGRGANAAADFAANKTITLPDARGRAIAGKDDMGGSAANRLTTAGSGIDGATLGTSGGAQTHTLTVAQLASHTHSYTAPANIADGVTGGVNTTVGATTGGTTGSNGSGDPHQNTQPTLVLNKIVKL